MKYSEALQHLTDEEWKKLSTQDKLDVLQAVENRVAAQEGRTPCTVQGKYIPSDSRGVTLGYYSRTDRKITINTEQLDSNSAYGNNYKEHLDTILHEGRHAYQDQAVRGEIKHNNSEEVAQWADNLKPGHYISYEKNPRGYHNQPVEKDARAFAKSAAIGIEEDKQRLKEQVHQQKKESSVSHSDGTGASGNPKASDRESVSKSEKKAMFAGASTRSSSGSRTDHNGSSNKKANSNTR